MRHKALANLLLSCGFNLTSIVEETRSVMSNSIPDLINKHFESRIQFEKDYFGYLFNNNYEEEIIKVSKINNGEIIDKVEELQPLYIITFGCSILSPIWVEKFQNRILGIHLGLSPYYKGAGTNFFPFVNLELGAVGYTLMNLDSGIDSGNIVHQARGKFVLGDSIHTVGCRIIQNMFEDIQYIIRNKIRLTESIVQPICNSKIYRQQDFNSYNLEIAYKNLQNNLIEKYLKNKFEEDSKFPIVKTLY